MMMMTMMMSEPAPRHLKIESSTTSRHESTRPEMIRVVKRSVRSTRVADVAFRQFVTSLFHRFTQMSQ